MKLAKAFYRLPMRFDVERLRAEVSALPAEAWAGHPSAIEGNSSVRLISAGGAENDDVHGEMLPTSHLRQCPYVRQVLASFGVVWSRSRLMRLDPHSVVPEHADINYHWYSRVRLHVPVFTRPEVRFHCDGQSVHMAPGEAWVFDNWRRHHVENPTDEARIHLVADTSGTAAFWQLVGQSDSPGIKVMELPYRPEQDAALLTEVVLPRPVMPPAEVDLLIADLRGELALLTDTPAGRAQLGRYHGLLQSFCFDWRQLFALHGESPAGAAEYSGLRDQLRAASRELGEGLLMRSNGVAAHTVLEGRLLRHLLHLSHGGVATLASAAPDRAPSVAVRQPTLVRPVFIVGAPRSGTTLLFETLAASRQLWTLGGEAHWLVESIPELCPGAAGVDSNRLTAQHCTDAVAARIKESLMTRLRDTRGQPLVGSEGEVRLLEKTPKNALRIPFFRRVFPDARFVFLWRDPRENISSMIEAWRSGKWITYPELEGWQGPWSLLLPPGWQALRGKALEEVAAYQWDCANRVMLDDLASLPRQDWTVVSYSDLVADPRAVVQGICECVDLDCGPELVNLVSRPLPLSRHTQTPPDPEKWRQNEPAIARILPSVEATWRRLRSL